MCLCATPRRDSTVMQVGDQFTKFAFQHWREQSGVNHYSLPTQMLSTDTIVLRSKAFLHFNKRERKCLKTCNCLMGPGNKISLIVQIQLSPPNTMELKVLWRCAKCLSFTLKMKEQRLWVKFSNIYGIPTVSECLEPLNLHSNSHIHSTQQMSVIHFPDLWFSV